MSKNTKGIIKAIGIPIITILIINLVLFLIELSKTDLINKGWSIVFKQGTFFINGKLTGMPFFAQKTLIIFLILCTFFLYKEYKKGNIHFKKISHI